MTGVASQILVACTPARYALLFGDGRQSFPATALIEAGLPGEELEHLRNGWLAREPVDNTFGRDRFRVAELPPDRMVDVTWRASITFRIDRRNGRAVFETRAENVYGWALHPSPFRAWIAVEAGEVRLAVCWRGDLLPDGPRPISADEFVVVLRRS